MIDAPNRAVPRFPRDLEPVAANAIIRGLSGLITRASPGRWLGVSAATAGSDILFLEACQYLGMPFAIVLEQETEAHIRTAVEYAGGNWVARFRQLSDAASEHSYLAGGHQDHAWRMMQYVIEKAAAIDLMLFCDPLLCSDVWRHVWQEVIRSGGRTTVLIPDHLR
jgi:hypothetical protein